MRRNLFAGSAYRMLHAAFTVQYAKSVYVYALSPDTKGPRREAKAHRCTRSDSRFSVAWARKQPSGTDEPRHCFVDHAYQLVFGHLGSPIRLCHVSMPSSGHLSSIIGHMRDQGGGKGSVCGCWTGRTKTRRTAVPFRIIRAYKYAG